MAHDIKKLLQTFLADKNNWKMQLLQNWPTIIGDLRTKVCLEKICDETLVLGVYDSCWLQELYLLSPILLKTINEKLENKQIKRLRFKQTGRKDTQKKKLHTDKKAHTNTITLTKKEHDTLEKIKDPALEEVLKKFLIRCRQEKD